MQKFIVLVAVGAACVSAPTFAQGQSPGGYMQRDQTRAEAQQRADMMFQMIDANKDGTVTKAEADQALAQFAARSGGDNSGRGAGRMQRMLEQAFAASPSLTLAQFEAMSLARFDAMDLNHDGTVTAAEREQFRAARQGQVVPATQPKVQ